MSKANYYSKIELEHTGKGADRLKIAICDDDPKDLLQIVSLLESYRHDRKADFYYVSFENATELLASMDRWAYDLLLLDILMPGVSGMQAAREIRQRDSRAEIVFLTSSPEYAVESYSVRAHYYLLKPVTEEKLFPILDRLASDFKKPEDALRITTQGNVFNLPYRKIECVEVIAKKLYFYLIDGSSREISGSLADFEQLLLRKSGFIKVHRSYIINLQWVQELRQREIITAAGRRVPVARAACAQVRTAYTEFLFEEAGELTRGGGGASTC